MNKLGVDIDVTRILEGKVRTWTAKEANTENGELETESTGTGQTSERFQQNKVMNHQEEKNLVTVTRKMIYVAIEKKNFTRIKPHKECSLHLCIIPFIKEYLLQYLLQYLRFCVEHH